MFNTFRWNSSHSDSQVSETRRQVRRRQVLTILFAIILLSVAGVSSAQSPELGCSACRGVSGVDDSLPTESIACDGITNAGAVLPVRDLTAGGAVPQQARVRPVSVELSAWLANFDSDAQPDGWRAEVVLIDHHDQPLAMRSQATFELMPRLSTVDGTYIDGQLQPFRWTQTLNFDDQQVANVKLPLRRSMRPQMAWPLFSSRMSRTSTHSSRSFLSNHRRSLATLQVHSPVATPSVGRLSVRVSVPTAGVYEAMVPVRIRPSVLVDTQWPYR